MNARAVPFPGYLMRANDIERLRLLSGACGYQRYHKGATLLSRAGRCLGEMATPACAFSRGWTTKARDEHGGQRRATTVCPKRFRYLWHQLQERANARLAGFQQPTVFSRVPIL